MVNANMGSTDRIIRAILGVVAIILGYTYSAWFYVLALILLFTAAINYCFLYEIFGISTAEKKKKK